MLTCTSVSGSRWFKMNEILRIARSDEAQKLCIRCLGRLFGKLGHNLDNPTRGRAVSLLLHLDDSLNSMIKKSQKKGSEKKGFGFEDLTNMLDNFEFQEYHMQTLGNIIGIYQAHNDIEKIKSDADAKSLENRIKEIISPEFVENLLNDDMSCELCNEVFSELPKFSELVCDSIKDYEFNDFLIGCKLDADAVATEEAMWSKLGIMHPEPMKGEFNRELGKLVGPKINKNVNFNSPDITILVDTRYDNITLQIASLFIYGRYLKMVRDIPQTKWPCKRCWGKGCDNCNGTGKIYPTSVEEEIAKRVMEITKAKNHLFHGMGREDIGVQMLGNGRPFILEVTQPMIRNVNLRTLEKEINEYTKDRVQVNDLRFSDHKEVRQIKAAKPNKTYRIKINLEKNLNKGKLKDIVSTFSGRTIKQRTPVRVSHRRADLVRERKVLEMALLNVSDKGRTLELEITGESGLYIKELIHGDSGRTTPSLADELSIVCTVEELDVIRINDE